MSDKTFHIGLCMAGAISAGAYTAGVMDFLIEALDEWERRKGEPNIPTHSVKIPVMGGASAGGMTSLIAASAVYNHFEPVRQLPGKIEDEVPHNRFYHSWVDLTGYDMFPQLLGVDDIAPKQIYSLLNAAFIDNIANKVLTKATGPEGKRPYLDQKLKVFVTLSNLRGFTYDFGLRSDEEELSAYLMSQHSDFACFMLNSEKHERGWIPLDFNRNINVDLARHAAMATGAFPVGLRARKLSRDVETLREIAFLKDVTGRLPIDPPSYPTINVDGGLINNEPFERVREVLCDITGEEKHEYADYDKVRSTVLMIDPFPSHADEFTESEFLFDVAGHTLSAMINQLRTKPVHLAEAMKSNFAGTYLIAPTRTPASGKKKVGSKAIACGSFGGFGGFISKEFRVHDYFLGRANCEKFLRDYFTVPASSENPIFKDGYANVNDKMPYLSRTDKTPGLQIIPVLKPEGQMYMPSFRNGKTWPTVKEEEIDRFRPMMKKRTEAILMNMSDYNWTQRMLLSAGAKLFISGKVSDKVLGSIKKSLREHEIL